MPRFGDPEPLGDHIVEGFDCGRASLNVWLVRYARQAAAVGAWLLRDSTTRTLAAAETIGVRAMLVHAIDEDAAAFYLRHGLEPAPSDPRHVMILIKDVAAALNIARQRR